MRFCLRLPALASLVFSAAVLGATASAARAQDTIKIGEFASLTGKEATYGQTVHKGTLFAIEEVNAAGGVLGKKLELVVEDDQSKPGEAATIAKKFVSRDKVVAILGELTSSRTLEAAPVAQNAKIPLISPGATAPEVTARGNFIFRVCFVDSFQGAVMAKFALAHGWKKVALLTDVKQDYSVGLAEFFVKYFKENGGEIVREQKYSSGDKDFKPQLTSLKAAQPDAIFVPGYYAEVALIGKQARLLGLKMPLLGGDGWMGDSLLKVAGNSLDGCFFSCHFSTGDQRPVVQDFIKKFRAKYKEEPDDMAALGYDSAMILAEAIRRAGTTENDKLRDAIAATRNHPGVTGNITLDEKRNAAKPAVILTIRDGGFKFTQSVAP